jgi:hypothetical protein
MPKAYSKADTGRLAPSYGWSEMLTSLHDLLIRYDTNRFWKSRFAPHGQCESFLQSHDKSFFDIAFGDNMPITTCLGLPATLKFALGFLPPQILSCGQFFVCPMYLMSVS